MKIGFEAFKDNYLIRDLGNTKLHVWYIENNETVLATMMLNELSDGVGRIENVCCEKSFRGKGLTQKIFNEVLKYSKEQNLKKLQLGTYENLERAIGFYLKNGFVEKVEKYDSERKAKYYELVL